MIMKPGLLRAVALSLSGSYRGPTAGVLSGCSPRPVRPIPLDVSTRQRPARPHWFPPRTARRRSLADNNIGDQGAQELAAALKKSNFTLAELE